ncbi:MAG: ribonuclease Y [Deltaproteobacteria bacterium]|nr:ribonuclease Y [Deltaproteobacteria bacterium]
MPIEGTIIIVAVVALGLGYALSALLQAKRANSRTSQAKREADQIVEEARKQADLDKRAAAVEARESTEKRRRDLEDGFRERKVKLNEQEKRLDHREETLEKRANLLDRQELDHKRREEEIGKQVLSLQEKEKTIQERVDEAQRQLERVAGMTREEAKKRLIDSIEEQARHDSAKLIKRIEEEAKMEADKKSKKIMITAIQRYASEYVAESTVGVVHLPNEDMKGRIIGREGRNIRALEAATGMDLIIDDTPEAVIISGFNPVRREVARLSLEKLVADGRIHPARIEEVVAKTAEELEVVMKEAGEQATFELGIHGIPHELIRYLGRLKYRTSYGQNQLQHAIEVGSLAGIMAAELGLNQRQAKRAGLLHDIGKSIDHEVEGSHAQLGADLLKKHGESAEIVQAVRAHHEEVKPESVLDILIQAADALSGARPGARREMVESYVKRLEELERLSKSFKGVDKAFAIQAGREVRVIVENSKIDDNQAVLLSKDIAKKIEEEMTYPGQIKVTVIRETRAVDYAR